MKNLLVAFLIFLVACASIDTISLVEEGEQEYTITTSSSTKQSARAVNLNTPVLKAKATFLSNKNQFRASMKFNWSDTTTLSGTVSLGVINFTALSAASGDIVVPLQQFQIRAGKTLEIAAGFKGNTAILQVPSVNTGGKFCALLAWHLTNGQYEYFQNTPIVYCLGIPPVDFTATIAGQRSLFVGNTEVYTITPIILPTTKNTNIPRLTVSVGAELELVGASGSGWTCDPPSVRAINCVGGASPLNVTIRALAPGGAAIQASISSIAPDPRPGNNTAALTIVGEALAAPADLALSLSTNSLNLNVGTNSMVDLTIINNGPNTSQLRQVSINRNLFELDILNVQGATCSTAWDCEVLPIPSGESRVMTFEIRAIQPFAYSDLGAGLQYDQNDQNQSNDSEYLHFDAINPNLIYDAGITLSNPSSTPVKNVPWTQTLTMTNTGNNSSLENRVLNIVTSNLAVTASSSSWCSIVGTGARCSVPSIAAQGNESITLTLTASSSGHNAITATLEPDINDNNYSNDSTLKNTYIEPVANDFMNLSFSSGVTPSRVPASAAFGQTYTFTVTNTGAITSAQTWVEWVGVPGAFYTMTGTNCIRLQQIGVIHCDIPNLAQGDTQTITVTRTTTVGTTNEAGYISIGTNNPNLTEIDQDNNTTYFDVVFP